MIPFCRFKNDFGKFVVLKNLQSDLKDFHSIFLANQDLISGFDTVLMINCSLRNGLYLEYLKNLNSN